MTSHTTVHDIEGDVSMSVHIDNDDDAAEMINAACWQLCCLLDHCARNHPSAISHPLSDFLQELEYLSQKHGFPLEILDDAKPFTAAVGGPPR
jgi:hypothetical protein